MNLALIFAGGVGKRMGNSGVPKQFLKLYGKEIIIYTLEIFENNENIDGIVISCLEEKIELLKKLIVKYEFKKIKSIVSGGTTGQESIFNGLKELEKYYSKKDIVLSVENDVEKELSKEDTVNIFKRFYRLDESHSSSGYGLGLPIAKEIVLMHKGEIKVLSKNKKVCFDIYFHI